MAFRPIRPAHTDASTLQDDDDPDSYRQQHQNHQSSAASSKTPVACWECRRKKTKCSGERPVCSACRRRASSCSYEAAAGQTRMGSLEQQLDTMKSVIHYLRSGTDDEAYEVLRRLRQSSDTEVDETLQLIRDGAMILDSSSPVNRHSPSVPNSSSQNKGSRTLTPLGERVTLPSLSNLLYTPEDSSSSSPHNASADDSERPTNLYPHSSRPVERNNR